MGTEPLRLGRHEIGAHRPPFVVAEMSGNHNRSLDRALAIVDAIAATGAHAVKLQTYTADTMTIDSDRPGFVIENPASPWHGRRLHELYEEAHTPWSWHPALFERARQHGLACFSSPFDASAVDFLEELDCPAYKVSSFEALDTELLRRVARTGKPVVVSTGMATLADVHEAVDTIRCEGNDQIVLLKCTSSYPAPPAESNLRTIAHLANAFGTPVGLSDHSLGIGAAIAAIALGASMIEKHFTLARSDGGVDAAFSLEPDEFALLVRESATAHASLGRIHYGPSVSERGGLQFRRSLYVVKDLEPGTVLTRDVVRAIRPGYGLPVRDLERVLGMRVRVGVARGTPLAWSHLREPS